jgi:hypothetical protein
MSSKHMVFITNSINIGHLGEHLLRGAHAHTDMRRSEDLPLDRTVLLIGVADDYRNAQLVRVRGTRSCGSYGQKNVVLICKICPGLRKTDG